MPGKRKLESVPREDLLRKRIRQATFKVLMKRGYAGTSTLEIASRAKVSKRELYALFRDKQDILASCIAERAKEMRLPLDFPAVHDLESLVSVLKTFGASFLRGISHPTVTALYRLAIVEGERSPEVAQALDSVGHGATRNALARVLGQAQSDGLLGNGDLSLMAEQFFALLWGGLRVQLLLGLAGPPSQAEIERRAHVATEALLALYARKRR
jgi:AcrR family transcriptional regulator